MRDEEGHVWIGVHFGSRGLGHSTATKYLKLAGGKDGMNVPPAILEAKSDLGRAYLAGMELGGLYAYVGREWVVERVGLRTPGTVFLVGGPAMTRARRNLCSRPVQARSSMPAICD